jgi:hypothetical protein
MEDGLADMKEDVNAEGDVIMLFDEPDCTKHCSLSRFSSMTNCEELVLVRSISITALSRETSSPSPSVVLFCEVGEAALSDASATVGDAFSVLATALQGAELDSTGEPFAKTKLDCSIKDEVKDMLDRFERFDIMYELVNEGGM